MKILILTFGSVSVYLFHKLAFKLKEAGHEVKYFMIKTAAQLMNMNESAYGIADGIADGIVSSILATWSQLP